MTAKTALDKYFELTDLGHIKTAREHVDFVLLGRYRVVPTKLVYHVPELPVEEEVPVS